eukprot:4192443-Prymnesium_polylepis.1
MAHGTWHMAHGTWHMHKRVRAEPCPWAIMRTPARTAWDGTASSAVVSAVNANVSPPPSHALVRCAYGLERDGAPYEQPRITSDTATNGDCTTALAR